MSNSATFFEPDALLPDQFFLAGSRDAGAGNEKQLMLAILTDAVECHQKYALTRSPQNREVFLEAHEWIFSDERRWPFSYENICDVLGIDPDFVRSALSKQSEAGESLEAAAKARRRPQIVSVLARRSPFPEDHEVELEELAKAS